VSFIDELKRRNVFRVGIAYVVVAWLIAQVADLVLDNIDAPHWLMQAILLLLGLGLPLALFFAWAFELTPEGLKKEKDVDRAQSITGQTGRKLDRLIIAVLVIALGYFAYDKFVLKPELTESPVSAGAQASGESSGVSEENPLEKSIAVLPFANRSNREEDEFFTEGIHDDLLTHLAKIGSLKVISRTSMLRYRNSEKSIPEIAGELKVATVLEGGIQRSGDQVRINVQLIDAKTDEHLWAEIFDRQLTADNLFAIQSEIATKIADALEATLSPEEKTRLSDVPTSNMAAYNAYLRGRQLQARRTAADLGQALAEFTRATELDPGYALAWVGVAETASLLRGYGTLDTNQSLSMQDEAVRKALAIDSELGEAYASLASLYSFREQNEQAEVAYKRSIALSPNYAPAYLWYSGFLSVMPDRLDESMALMEQAAQLDPLSSIVQSVLAERLAQLGRYGEAEAQYLRVIELDPEFAANYANLSGFYGFRLGRTADALKWVRVAREKDPGNIGLIFQEVQFYLDLGNYAAVETLHRQMQDLDRQNWTVGAVDLIVNLSRSNYAGAIEAGQWILPKLANVPPVQEFVGFAYLLNGDFARARELILAAYPGWEDPSQWARLIQADAANSCVVAGVLEKTGDRILAEKLVDQIIGYYASLTLKIEHADSLAPLDCWVLKGDYSKALDMLETRVAHGHYSGWWINYGWPWWDDVRPEPRFKAAMQTILDKVNEQSKMLDDMQIPL